MDDTIPVLAGKPDNSLFRVEKGECYLADNVTRGRKIYGVGVVYEAMDTLPEWVQSVLSIIDLGDDGNCNTVADLGFKGDFWYEFINPNEQPKE